MKSELPVVKSELPVVKSELHDINYISKNVFPLNWILLLAIASLYLTILPFFLSYKIPRK